MSSCYSGAGIYDRNGNYAAEKTQEKYSTERCGVTFMEDDANIAYCCLGPAGHTGVHYNGCGVTWAEVPSDTADPNAGEAETKHGKVRMELIDLNFVRDMAKQVQYGIRGTRVPWGWTLYDPDEWVPLLRGSILRHLTAAQEETLAKDSDTGASHWAAIAVNAMMCFGLERIKLGIDKKRA